MFLEKSPCDLANQQVNMPYNIVINIIILKAENGTEYLKLH